MTNFEYIITGLIGVLITVVGYFGQQIYVTVKRTEKFVNQQEIRNELNDKTLDAIDRMLDIHTEKIETHETRLTKVESDIQTIKTFHKKNHNEDI